MTHPNSPSAQRQIILTDLHVQTNIGILAHEVAQKQVITVDIKINLGQQDLVPASDDISAVLDYRLVYDAINDEVKQGHTNMLETLAGKICHRILQLPHVQGVWLRVRKPTIFPDANVGIELTAGSLS